MLHVHKKILFFALGFWHLIFNNQVLSTPLNNVFDTQPIYTVYGVDHFYNKKNKNKIRFYISPFYQQTSTARDNNGTKVPAGDRLGKWNMFGVFYGPGGAPTTLNFDTPFVNGETFHNLRVAQRQVQTITSQALTNTMADNRYRVGPQNFATGIEAGGLTNEHNFDTDKHPFVFVSVPTNYEKAGVRSQLNFDFCFGLGVSIKGGVVDVKQRPKDFKFETQFQADYTGVGESTSTDIAKKDARDLFCHFMSPTIRNRIAKDLEFDLNVFHKVAAEDLHLQVYWHFPIKYYDQSGDVGVTFIPHIALGVWLPTGMKIDHNKAFSVPTGNDGHVGGTFEASLGFDFPILPKGEQTLQFNVGGGILFFGEKNKTNYRFPSSQFQTGMIPWKIALLSKRPGLTWFFNASLQSEFFIEGLSVYLDFIYTKHLPDEFRLKDPNATRNNAFKEGIAKAERESSWKNQQVHGGMDYRLTDKLFLGGAVQAHISGIRVYRSVTLLGSVKVVF